MNDFEYLGNGPQQPQKRDESLESYVNQACKWIGDGDLDANWIESMNPVMVNVYGDRLVSAEDLAKFAILSFCRKHRRYCL